MSVFIDVLQDEEGKDYWYGHCYEDDDHGREFGCGMEYAYYEDVEVLKHWHDAVGLVTTVEGFTAQDVRALENEHAEHVRELWCAECGTREGPFMVAGETEVCETCDNALRALA